MKTTRAASSVRPAADPGPRPAAGAAAVAGYPGGGDRFDEAVSDRAAAYADVCPEDYENLRAAVRSGRLPADTGPEGQSVLRGSFRVAARPHPSNRFHRTGRSRSGASALR
ncbi:hypothetical protein [Nocardiopsis sp. CC223A]|uniref:hypothetical protein n=1 Tax=Nocardiopsis sp. CC223A TaxID=3044051 RepID=UPI002795BA99|nr:hypothetical protein [Nocardiopsis sp. CC223A]